LTEARYRKWMVVVAVATLLVSVVRLWVGK